MCSYMYSTYQLVLSHQYLNIGVLSPVCFSMEPTSSWTKFRLAVVGLAICGESKLWNFNYVVVAPTETVF